MLVYGEPEFFVQVSGDWYTVLRRLDKFYDILIDQKPDDELDADYLTYRIPVSKIEDVIEIYNLILGSGLSCCLGMRMCTDNISVDTIGGESNICIVHLDNSDEKRGKAIKDIINVLETLC